MLMFLHFYLCICHTPSFIMYYPHITLLFLFFFFVTVSPSLLIIPVFLTYSHNAKVNKKRRGMGLEIAVPLQVWTESWHRETQDLGQLPSRSAWRFITTVRIGKTLADCNCNTKRALKITWPYREHLQWKGFCCKGQRAIVKPDALFCAGCRYVDPLLAYRSIEVSGSGAATPMRW